MDFSRYYRARREGRQFALGAVSMLALSFAASSYGNVASSRLIAAAGLVLAIRAVVVVWPFVRAVEPDDIW